MPKVNAILCGAVQCSCAGAKCCPGYERLTEVGGRVGRMVM